MIKFYSKLITVICLTFTSSLFPKKSGYFSYRSSKVYTPKAPYSGIGKISATTGRYKVKSTRGYFKKSNGYKYVNSYARS
jgi:hypothetical protein